MKKHNEGLTLSEDEIEEIHMPNNSGLPFIMGIIFGVVGFLLIFEWKLAALVGAVGILVGLIVRSFDYNDGFHVKVDEIKKIEKAWRGKDKGVNNHVS
jgi:cytochrome aa3-600 menaquinol oxidase subunit 1